MVNFKASWVYTRGPLESCTLGHAIHTTQYHIVENFGSRKLWQIVVEFAKV